MSKNNCLWITNGLHIGDTGIMRYQYDPADSQQVLTKVCCRSKQHYDVSEKIDDPELKRLVLTEFSPQEHLEKVKNPKFNYENFKTTMCKTCHDAEKNTGGSMRTGYHNMFKHLPKTDKPRLLQIGFGNFCNFKCRYCTPRFSTTWNEDTPFMKQIREENRHNSENFKPTYTKITNTEQQTFDIEKEIVKQVESLDLSELVYLGVFGGEPFLSRHWQALVEVLEQKTDLSKVRLQINSNFSIFPKQPVIDVLTKFGHVDLRASVEAHKDLAEYIRAGLKWPLFEKNFDKWQDVAKEFPNIKPAVHMANNVYNINKVLDFEQWLLEKQVNEFYIQFVYDPPFLDLRKVLSPKQIDICVERIQNLKLENLKSNLMRFVPGKNLYDKELVKKFKFFTESLDKVRKQKLSDVNPELAEWISNEI